MTKTENKRFNCRKSKAKGQIALWMLTKFAMIFFILALALVLLGYSGVEKKNLCVTRAQGLASAIRSSIANVLTAPVEDERKVIPLERVLSIGESDYVKYKIKITNLQASGGSQSGTSQSNQLVIEVLPTGAKECNGGGNVPYPTGTTMVFGGTAAENKEELELDPYGGIGGVDRSWYLVILKCKTKYWPPKEYIYLEDCKNQNPNTCLDFESVEKCCGWPGEDNVQCP